jgi:hypothetical protein
VSIDRRIGSKIPEFVKFEDVSGTRISPGPFVGKIKNNLDPTHSGRLQVWIPEFGGDENNTENWRTVSYASPFLGSTPREEKEQKADFAGVPHTYGMWFTVPDLENFVLCIFVAGDPRRGFWFACVPKNVSQYMLPAIGATSNYDSTTINDSKLKAIKKHSKLPVAEFNENIPSQDLSNFKTSIKKPVHEEQLKLLVEQGLDRDDTRGIITSSSQRESPSSVYGFSTPGRPIVDPNTELLKSSTKKEISPKDLAVKSRKGGHSLVMDDGDSSNKNQLLRLRSATGHQILMNDSDNILYIINNKGTAWVEFTEDGKINIFSNSELNIRSKSDLNIHSDKDININAENNLNICAKKKATVESESLILRTSKKTTMYSGGGTQIGSKNNINLHATVAGSFMVDNGLLIHKGSKILLNTAPGTKVPDPGPLVTYQHSDTAKDSNGQWQEEKNKIKSVAKIITSHEPWNRKEGIPNSAISSASSAATSNAASVQNKMRFRTYSESTSTTPASASTSTASTSLPIASESNVKVATNGTQVDSQGKPVLANLDASINKGLQDALVSSVVKPADPSLMKRTDNPNPPGGIGKLSQVEVKALMTQIAHNESSFNYNIREAKRGNYLGKYQMGAAALVDQGYIKREAYDKYGTQAVNYQSSWTNKDNVKSADDFLNNPQAQENAMYGNLQTNYDRLVRNGGITPTDDPAIISGMLSTAHLLGAGGVIKKSGELVGALAWRQTGAGEDANKTSGTQYFNAGRYAYSVLSKVN